VNIIPNINILVTKYEKVISCEYMNPELLENRLAILLAKYDIEAEKNTRYDVLPDLDMSEIGLLLRENRELNAVIEKQNEIIDIFRIKYLDISLEYNERIERIRRDHQNELKNLHSQFRERLKATKKQNNI